MWMCGVSIRVLGAVCFRLLTVFFFFQAEDGIRDVAVTGVQTCALPICEAGPPRDAAHLRGAQDGGEVESQPPTGGPAREWVRPTGRLMAGREVDRKSVV